MFWTSSWFHNLPLVHSARFVASYRSDIPISEVRYSLISDHKHIAGMVSFTGAAIASVVACTASAAASVSASAAFANTHHTHTASAAAKTSALNMDGYELAQVIVVSRHGIRTPYAPRNATVDDYTSYSGKKFPDNNTWGMTYDAFAHQHLTPHGVKVLPLLSNYYRQYYDQGGLTFSDCSTITCFADDNSRDIQSAELWLEGFGCPSVPVKVVNAESYPEMRPVLMDNYRAGDCPISTEDQVMGMFGGDVNAITEMYRDGIELVSAS